MYAGEPTSAPVTVIRSPGSSTRAMPKSISFRTPSSRTITFSGLRSRWMTPASCACPSARASCWITSAASSGGKRRSRSAKHLQRLAPDQLGDQERVLGGRRVGEVEHLEDVGVLQPRHRPGLAGQPRAGVLLPRQVRVEDLHRDLAVKRGVHAPVDDRHASRAEWLEQPISPQMPALEAHPEMAPPESRNARLPRNVPHCSGLAAQEAMWSRTAPGKARFSPFPVRAFPASYAWLPAGSTSAHAQTRDAARSGLRTASSSCSAGVRVRPGSRAPPAARPRASAGRASSRRPGCPRGS